MRASTLALFCAVLCLPPAASAQARRPPEETVANSLRALGEVTRNPKTGMPRLVMRNAQGIAIIPDMFKAGFIIGARFGRGVLLVKQPDGSWSNPLFIRLAGGSLGPQVGAQSTDLILVFQTQRGLDRFIKGKGKLTLGVDVGAAAGPVGKRFEAGTDVAMQSEILSYSNTRGIFAGVSAEGGKLQVDWQSNMSYYGRPVASSEVLAVNSKLPVPPPALSLRQMLAEKTAWPAGAVIEDRPGAPIILEEDDDEFIMENDDAPRVIRSEPIRRPAEPSLDDQRSSSKPKPKPRPVPRGDLDFDDDFFDDGPNPLPSAKPAPRAPTNPEDLPAPAPAPEAKPAQPQADPGDGDEVPRLEPPAS